MLADARKASGVNEQPDGAFRPDARVSRLTDALLPNDSRQRMPFPITLWAAGLSASTHTPAAAG